MLTRPWPSSCLGWRTTERSSRCIGQHRHLPGDLGQGQPDGTNSLQLSVQTQAVEVGGFATDQAQTGKSDTSTEPSDTVALLRDLHRHRAASKGLVRAKGPTLHLPEASRWHSTGAARGLLRWVEGISHWFPARTHVAPEGPDPVSLATVDGSLFLPLVHCRPSEWVVLRTIALLRSQRGTPPPG